MRLVRELDDRVRVVIEQPVKPGELRSAYCRTRSGTSRFLPLTMVLTAHLPARTRATGGGARARRTGPARSSSIAATPSRTPGTAPAGSRVRGHAPTASTDGQWAISSPTITATSTMSAGTALAVRIPSQNTRIPISDTTAPTTAIGRHQSIDRRRPVPAATNSTVAAAHTIAPAACAPPSPKVDDRSHEPPDWSAQPAIRSAGPEEQDVTDTVGDENDGKDDAQDLGRHGGFLRKGCLSRVQHPAAMRARDRATGRLGHGPSVIVTPRP